MYPWDSSSEPSPEKITTLSDFSLMYFEIKYIPTVEGTEEAFDYKETAHETVKSEYEFL